MDNIDIFLLCQEKYGKIFLSYVLRYKKQYHRLNGNALFPNFLRFSASLLK